MTTVTMRPADVVHPASAVHPAKGSVRPAAVVEQRDAHVSGRHGTLARPRPVACTRSYEPDLHGSRLTRRGKVVVVLLWLALAVVMAVMVARPADVPVPAGTTTVVVQPGDTVWGLAGGLTPGLDRRAVVRQIMELNGLRSATEIRPGDVLVLPVGG